MKLTESYKEARERRSNKWKPYYDVLVPKFAYFPVQVNTGEWVWWQIVYVDYRVRNYGNGYEPFEFSPIYYLTDWKEEQKKQHKMCWGTNK